MFRLDYFSGKLVMKIIQVLWHSHPQIKRLSQIIREFLDGFFAVIRKLSAQPEQSAEKCKKKNKMPLDPLK